MRLTAGLLLVASLGAAAIGAAGSPPAGAQDAGCENAPIGSQCEGSRPPRDGPGATGPRGPSVPVDFEHYFDEDGTGVGAAPGYEDDGCWGIRAVPAGQGTTWEEAVEAQDGQGQNGVLWGSCAVEDTIDPAFLAGEHWRRAVVPPPPTPLVVAPGRALAGLAAYLEIGGDVPDVQTFATPIGTLTFTLTPRYEVAWGDGATTGTTSQGRPYPGGPGEITHTYTRHGAVTITVTAHWTASWSLAGAGGDLPEHPVPTEGSLELPVEQRQAVVD